MKSTTRSKQGMTNFWIRNSKEIRSIIQRLVKGSITVTAYSDNNKDFILTSVLSLQKKPSVLILDEGTNERLNARLLDSSKITCEAELQHVKIRFDCNTLSRARYKGRGVFVCPVPDALFYFERRESFRVSTPTTNPPLCSLRLENEETVEFSVVDISAYGLGMVNPIKGLDLQTQVSLLYTNCGLLLPDFGETVVDLQLRNFRRVLLKNVDEVQRIGALFVHLSPGIENFIQRYVNNLQIKQIAIVKSD